MLRKHRNLDIRTQVSLGSLANRAVQAWTNALHYFGLSRGVLDTPKLTNSWRLNQIYKQRPNTPNREQITRGIGLLCAEECTGPFSLSPPFFFTADCWPRIFSERNCGAPRLWVTAFNRISKIAWRKTRACCQKQLKAHQSVLVGTRTYFSLKNSLTPENRQLTATVGSYNQAGILLWSETQKGDQK